MVRYGLGSLGLILVLGLAWFLWPADVHELGRLGPAGRQDLGSLENGSLTSIDGAETGTGAEGKRQEVGAAARGSWPVNGRVVFEGVWPVDEQARVVAWAGEQRLGAADVERGGRFQMELSTENVELELEARYLVSAERVPVKRGRDVEIVAEFGAYLVVAVQPGPGVTVDELGAVKVDVRLGMGGANERLAMSRVADVEGIQFELCGFATDQLFSVSVRAPGLVAAGSVGHRAMNGLRSDLEFVLRRGAAIEGVVLGASGEGLEGARVSLARRNPERFQMLKYLDERVVETDGEGRFRAQGLAPGEWRLTGRVGGLLPSGLDLEDLVDRELRSGVVLSLQVGGSLAGLVMAADGSPASGARVTLIVDGDPWGAKLKAIAAEDGSFVFDGLVERRYMVTATVDSGAGLWRASRVGVEPGENVNLTLEAGDRISGTVVDDRGERLEKFTVIVKATEVSSVMDGPKPRKERYRKAGGAFDLSGLQPGVFDVRVEAKGHADSVWKRLSVPEGIAHFDFVLDRTASVVGVLLLPSGEPAAASEVLVEQPGSATRKGKTNSAGEFEIDGLVPGEVHLIGTRQGLRDSETMVVHLSPGVELGDVQLTLRGGARISGQVDASIEDFTAHNIMAMPANSYASIQTLCDQHGRFEFAGLEPGVWTVYFDWMAAGGGQRDWVAGFGERRAVEVEVFEGQTTDMVLGLADPSAVHISGAVTDDGESKPGYIVYVYPEVPDPGKPEGMPAMIARTDGEGRYSMTLPHGGKWRFSVGADTNFQVAFHETLPALPAVVLDFELPNCAFKGRVIDAQGSAIPRHRLMLVRADAAPGSRAFGDLATATTDTAGGFEFVGLPAGDYLLRTGGWGLPSGGWGVRVIEGIRLGEEQAPVNLDVTLVAEAVILGGVRDSAGNPVANAVVNARDANGHRLFVWGESRTDYTGGFRLAGIGAGDCWIHVKADDGRSSSAPIVSTPGQVLELTLEL